MIQLQTLKLHFKSFSLFSPVQTGLVNNLTRGGGGGGEGEEKGEGGEGGEGGRERRGWDVGGGVGKEAIRWGWKVFQTWS